MKQSLGTKLSPILAEIEDALWDFEADRPGIKPEFTAEGFRAALKIFMCVLLDKMYEYQRSKLIPLEEASILAEEAGKEIRAFVKKYIGIDTHVLYKI